MLPLPSPDRRIWRKEELSKVDLESGARRPRGTAARRALLVVVQAERAVLPLQQDDVALGQARVALRREAEGAAHAVVALYGLQRRAGLVLVAAAALQGLAGQLDGVIGLGDILVG